MSSGKRKELSKRQEFKEKRRKRQQQQKIIVGVIVAAAAIVILGLVIGPTIYKNTRPVGEIVAPAAIARTITNENTMGDPNAPVKIVEYSDFQCPACKAWTDQTEAALIEKYVNTGKVFFTYRSMGQWIGPESVAAAEAAYCAGDQGKFWEYHDTLFANHTGENVGDFTERRLLAFAETLKLDMKEFKACLNSNKFLSEVNGDQADGRSQGAEATPTFFVNGQLVRGAANIEQFSQIIDPLLGGTQ